MSVERKENHAILHQNFDSCFSNQLLRVKKATIVPSKETELYKTN